MRDEGPGSDGIDGLLSAKGGGLSGIILVSLRVGSGSKG